LQDFPPSIKPVANPEFELCATIAGGDGTDMVLTILLQVVACELRSNVLQVVLSEAQPAGDDLYSS
jgi:hypothetical protein